MPRVGPTYSLPEAPFTPLTPISSSAVNNDLSDIADALTASLARDGSGGMTAVLPLVADGFNFIVDPDTGIHRDSANTMRLQAGGVDIFTVNASSATVAGDFNTDGTIFQNGRAVLLVGEIKIWSGISAPNAEWVICNGQTLLRADYPDLWTFASGEIAGGNLLFTNGNGTTTFTVPDFRGRVPAMVDGTGKLTATTINPNGTTLGGVSSNNNQTITLLTANLPAYTPTGSFNNGALSGGTISGTLNSGLLVNGTLAGGTASVTSSNWVASNSSDSTPINPGGTGGSGGTVAIGGGFSVSKIVSTGTASGSAGTVTGSVTGSVSGSASGGSGTVTGTLAMNAQGGSATPFPNVQPTILANYIMYAGTA